MLQITAIARIPIFLFTTTASARAAKRENLHGKLVSEVMSPHIDSLKHFKHNRSQIAETNSKNYWDIFIRLIDLKKLSAQTAENSDKIEKRKN